MTNPTIKTINVHELQNEMKNDSHLCLIDVRERDEWEEMHIAEAIHIPKDQIASTIEAKVPDKNQTVYLHCKAGVRSLYAAQLLISQGYQNVYSVDGGIIAWAVAGYPVHQHTTTL